MVPYVLIHDEFTGVLLGVRRTRDNAFIPKSDNNRDWRWFLDWNAQQPVPLDLSDLPAPPRRRPRSIQAIVADLYRLGDVDQRLALMRTVARRIQMEPQMLADMNILGDEPVP